MDLITQGVLGAVVGQLSYQKKLGKKAIFWGAVGGLIPDLDILVKFSSNPFAEMLYHRGLTHSLFFGPLLGIFLGYLLWKKYKIDKPSSWIGLMILALTTHPLLDYFTIYGTQLLAPFSYHRFFISGVSIIDPLYTVPLMISICVGLCAKEKVSTLFAGTMLFMTSLYLVIGVFINHNAYAFVEKDLKDNHLYPEKINVYTTIFQLPLRRIVVHFDHQVWVGYLNVFNKKSITWNKTDKAPEYLCKNIKKTNEYEIFQWFCNHDSFISIDKEYEGGKTLMVKDLRYGFNNESQFGIFALHIEINSQGELVYPIKPYHLSFKKDYYSLMKELYYFLFLNS